MSSVYKFILLLKKIIKKTYLVLFEALVSAAVFLNINWPAAYRFKAYKYLNKYKDLVFISKGASQEIRSIQQKIIFCLEKYISFEPSQNKVSEWIDANFRLSGTFLSIPEIESINKASLIAQRVEQFRRKIPIKFKITEPDIAFVPRPLAEGSLGVYENLESYLKAMRLGLVPVKKLFFIVDPKTKVNNPFYLKCWGKHVVIVTDEKQIKSLTPQELYLTIPMLGLFKQYGEKSLLMHIGLGMVREQWIKKKYEPLLTLNKEDEKRGWDCLKLLGFPEGSWFVGLHIREPGWRDEGAKAENARNANIQTYYESIKSITDAGGWVIRLGDPVSMTPLPKMEHVIDYAHSEVKSDWMDIFLSAKCRFLIGTASGIYTVSLAFGVPSVLTNFMSPHNMYALTSQDICIPKICFSKKEDRKLTFKELITPPVGVAIHAYQSMGIEVIENTSEEIKAAVDEMLARFDNSLEYTEEDNYLQNKFQSIVNSCSELYGDKDARIYARLSRDFLRRHADLLSSEVIKC